jgi:TonB-dependent Receptor Plug Domain.
VRSILLLAVAASLLAGRGPALAQAPSPSTLGYRHRILGVFDAESGEPIEGVQVLDALNGVSALTTSTGTVSLRFLPEGGSMVQIRKVGYRPTTLVIEIGPADTIPLTVVIARVAAATARSVQTLPTVVTKDSSPRSISPGLNAFEERRRSGFGHFITEAELRKQDNRTMTNVIRDLPGVTMVCPKTGPRKFECYAISGRGNKNAILGGGCEMNLYIDNVAVSDNDLVKLNVSEFAAIEFYSGGATIPAQYNRTGASCGVILLWTRER